MTYYRYYDYVTGAAEDVGTISSTVRVDCREYFVIKTTPKGVWLWDTVGDTKRFVLDGARKKFTHPTKLKALESYRARKRCQVSIRREQLRRSEHAYCMAEVLLHEEKCRIQRETGTPEPVERASGPTFIDRIRNG